MSNTKTMVSRTNFDAAVGKLNTDITNAQSALNAETESRKSQCATMQNKISSVMNDELSEDTGLAWVTTKSGAGWGSPLSTAMLTSLWNLLQKVAYVTADVSSQVSAFKEAWGITQKLSSINANYTGGDVVAGIDTSSLTGLTITAIYSDGTSSVITSGYTLSPNTIQQGTNTITVTYLEKTCTFVVTGVSHQYNHIMLNGYATAYYTASGVMMSENSERSAIVSTSGTNPLSISKTSYVASEYYPYAQITSDMKKLTFACVPNESTYGTVYCGILIIHWDGSKWIRDVDVGWSTPSGWTFDLTPYNDGTHYFTTNFINSDKSEAITQLTMSDVTLTIS